MQLITALEIPSLLIIGDVGSVVTLEMARELAGLNECLKITQIKETGHGIPYDQPKRFSAIVQTFLGPDITTFF